ncbi:Uncharacterised protein [Sporosarcina pasteurii]|uniref:Uncharacterized protein n=1 Tax=Sporosarcina pasteurii TaxID=1474 RepID=A0A380BSQ8_SPOPA|nr:Uncharacterised protein [Sporosarcina pasteurii]
MHFNHLIEIGLNNLLAHNESLFKRRTKLDDQVQFKSTYDDKLLQNVKLYAKTHRVFINDVIEWSIEFIDE